MILNEKNNKYYNYNIIGTVNKFSDIYTTDILNISLEYIINDNKIKLFKLLKLYKKMYNISIIKLFYNNIK